MDNIILCEHCAKKTTFERNTEKEPAEGNICSICGDWVCDNCIDWNKSYKNGFDFICKDCADVKMYPFLCKAFIKGEWKVLGIVHAKDADMAWEIAHKTWKKVDSVYDLYSCD